MVPFIVNIYKCEKDPSVGSFSGRDYFEKFILNI